MMTLPRKVPRRGVEATLNSERSAAAAQQPQEPSPSGRRGCRKGPNLKRRAGRLQLDPQSLGRSRNRPVHRLGLNSFNDPADPDDESLPALSADRIYWFTG
jgi:hypothetical protein